MSETELTERCPDPECDSTLVEVSADDDTHSFPHPIVVCPGCLEIIRHETGDDDE